jgi:hypothetical protein
MGSAAILMKLALRRLGENEKTREIKDGQVRRQPWIIEIAGEPK